MPNIGLPELVIVLVIALVVFGPKRLPQMGRQLGQALREFKSATAEVRAQVGVDEIAGSVNDIKSSLSLTGPDAATPAAVDAGPQPAPATADAPATAPEPDVAPATADEATVSTETEAAGPAGKGGIESFGKLKRSSAAAPGPAGEGGIESFGKLKRSSAAAARSSSD